MKKLILRDWLILVTILVPFPFIGFAWDMFPEQVPIHFNFSGKPDRYADKSIGLFILPVINFVLYMFLNVLPTIDPVSKNFSLIETRYRAIRLVTHTLLTFVFFLVAIFSLGYTFDLTMVLSYALVLMLLLFGNYMSNVRTNYFFGIRTPWTLSNEVVWRKTHRFSARLWVFSSLIMMVILPFIPGALIGFLVFVFLITIIPIVYSYIVFRNLSKAER